MSLGSMLISEASIGSTIEIALSVVMNQQYGMYLPSAATAEFSAAFAQSAATPLAASAYEELCLIGRTCFLIGIALPITTLAIAGSLCLLLRNPKRLPPH